jgi:hypothetical protein
MATTLLMSGCSIDPVESAGQTRTDAAGTGAGETDPELIAARVPQIGVMNWPELRRYCTFFADGHAFDSDDKSSWQFVFVTPFTPSRRDAWAVAALNGERQMLDRVSRREAGGTETRRYRSVDDPEIELEVILVSTGRGTESIRYSGSIRVAAPARGQPVRFSGRCGA